MAVSSVLATFLLAVGVIVNRDVLVSGCTDLMGGNDRLRIITIASDNAINVITNISPFRYCIRCGIFQSLSITPITDPSMVEYIGTDGQPIGNDTNGVTITDGGLLIDNPINSFNDGDMIQCNIDGGPTLDMTFDFFDFSSPPITPSGSVLNYVEGDDVALTCIGDGRVIFDFYQWTLPDGTLEPSTPVLNDDNVPLALSNIDRTDSGVYTCAGRINNEVIVVESDVTLNVQYPARVLSFTPVVAPGENTALTIGSTLTLNCSYEGNPTPSVSWSREGTLLDVTANPALSETITDNYALLEITFINNVELSGEYTCTVNNNIGANQPQGNTKSLNVTGPDFIAVTTTYTTSSAAVTSTILSSAKGVVSTSTYTAVVATSSTVVQSTMTPHSDRGGLPLYVVILMAILSFVTAASLIGIVLLIVICYYRNHNKMKQSSTANNGGSVYYMGKADMERNDMTVNTAYGTVISSLTDSEYNSNRDSVEETDGYYEIPFSHNVA